MNFLTLRDEYNPLDQNCRLWISLLIGSSRSNFDVSTT
jgi:hypothetical protein